MGLVAARRVGDPGVGLVQPDVVVLEVPGRPAAHDLGGVEPLERHALGGHRRGVDLDVDLGVVLRVLARPDVEPAGPDHDRGPGLALHLGPARRRHGR